MISFGDRTPSALLISSLTVGFMTTGCASVQSILPFDPTDATLTLNVESLSSPGEYAVSGEASLPDNTEIAVLAIRNLYSKPYKDSDRSEQTYSVLAFSSVPIINGSWQTTLDFWQVAPDGRYQETWQIEAAKLDVDFEPDDSVIVLATLSPIDTFVELEQQLATKNMRFPRDVVRSNADGDRYAQIFRAIRADLPSGTAPSDVASLDDENWGWGDRYLIPPEPENPAKLEQPSDRITDAPIGLDEMLR